MDESVEAVFLSKSRQVLKVSPALKPWRSLSACRNARSMIEWRPGHAARRGLRAGAQLHHTPNNPLTEPER